MLSGPTATCKALALVAPSDTAPLARPPVTPHVRRRPHHHHPITHCSTSVRQPLPHQYLNGLHPWTPPASVLCRAAMTRPPPPTAAVTFRPVAVGTPLMISGPDH